MALALSTRSLSLRAFHSNQSNQQLRIHESLHEQSIGYASSFNRNQQKDISEVISMSKGAGASSVGPQKKNTVTIVGKNEPKAYQNQGPSNRDRSRIEHPISENHTAQNSPSANTSHNITGPHGTGPIFLGESVLNTIAVTQYLQTQERYYDISKVRTRDVRVLFDFFQMQKRNLRVSNLVKTVSRLDVEVPGETRNLEFEMPGDRKKRLFRDFERILTFDHDDVFFTLNIAMPLQVQREKTALQMKLMQKHMKQEASAKKAKQARMSKEGSRMSSMIQPHKAQAPETQFTRRLRFGCRLSECFQNSNKDNTHGSDETLQKLNFFWRELIDRAEWGLQWDEQTVYSTIKQYMRDQVALIRQVSFEKYHAANQNAIQRLYKDNYKLANYKVYIPRNSLSNYLNMADAEAKADAEASKAYETSKDPVRAKPQRPVSATPLTILAKPKQTGDHTDLFRKYPTDHLLQRLMKDEHQKKARRAFQYGVYSLEEEIKIKNRVKIDAKKGYGEQIDNYLIETFSSALKIDQIDGWRKYLTKENIHKEEVWNKYKSRFQQTLLVKVHEAEWCRKAVVMFCTKNPPGKDVSDYNVVENKVLVNDLIYLMSHNDDQRRQKLIERFEDCLNKHEEIAQRTAAVQAMNTIKISPAQQERAFEEFLGEKAKQYWEEVQNVDEDFTVRGFQKKIFEEAKKEHSQVLQRRYGLVTGSKDCPKMLIKDFDILLKEVNPLNKMKDDKPRCHAWIPSNKNGMSATASNFSHPATQSANSTFSLTTHNQLALAYHKDKNLILNAKAEPATHGKSLWSRKKGEEREKLMMKYEDAKQCTFHPKCARHV